MTAQNTLTRLYMHLKEKPTYQSSLIEMEKAGSQKENWELKTPDAVEAAADFIKECLGGVWPHSIDFADPEMAEAEYADFDEPALEPSQLNLMGDWRRVAVYEGKETQEHPGAHVILFEKEGDKFRVLDWIRDDVKSRA